MDNHTSIKGLIDRIAYCVELLNGKGEQQFLYVSMDAFTQDLAKIGVPPQASGAFFQQNVAALNVESNVKGIVTGSGIPGGNIEFWPFIYAPDNSGKAPMLRRPPTISVTCPTEGAIMARCRCIITTPDRRSLR